MPLLFALVPLTDLAADEAIAYANARGTVEVIDQEVDQGIDDDAFERRFA
jgi:hypothetical protein